MDAGARRGRSRGSVSKPVQIDSRANRITICSPYGATSSATRCVQTWSPRRLTGTGRAFRRRGIRRKVPELATPPIDRPSNWLEYVNLPQTDAELAAIRRATGVGAPFGEAVWSESCGRSHWLAAARSAEKGADPFAGNGAVPLFLARKLDAALAGDDASQTRRRSARRPPRQPRLHAAASSAAQTTIMPTPILNARNISSARDAAASCSSRKIGGTVHDRRSTSAAHRSGSIRGRFSVMPPPVMCARPFTNPRSSSGRTQRQIRPMRREQRVADRRAEFRNVGVRRQVRATSNSTRRASE